MNQPKIVIDVFYNEEKKHFEVWATSTDLNMKALLLVQTQQDIIDQLHEMMLSQLEQLTPLFNKEGK